MPFVKPKAKEIFLLENRFNNELNLEHTDQEVRMEQVRQMGRKLEWPAFGQSVRRNLLEKKNTLDTDSRIDILKGIAFMKKKMPIDLGTTVAEKFKIMAESLGCTCTASDAGWNLIKEDLAMTFTVNDDRVTAVILSFWEESSFYSAEATVMLQDGKWTEFREEIARMLAIYDKDISIEDTIICKKTMETLQSLFMTQASNSEFSAINQNMYGCYVPREELRAGRLYYLVEPLYQKVCLAKNIYHMSEMDYDQLPYMEFSFLKHHRPCYFPIFEDEWTQIVEANATICLKLSKGFLLSQHTRRRISQFSSRTVEIRHYTNLYRHTLGEVEVKKDLKMITQFKQGAQHLYTINKDCFLGNEDTVITAIYLKNVEDLAEVISLLRNEIMHISLWESIMAMCYEKHGIPKHTVSAMNVNINLERSAIVISFDTVYRPLKLMITDNGPLSVKVTVFDVSGNHLADDVDNALTQKLNESWSIPAMLTYAISDKDCPLQKINVPIREEPVQRPPYIPPPVRKNFTMK